MPARKFPYTTTLCSSTRMCLPRKMWLGCGRQEEGMQGLKLTMPVAALPITLRRCFRTRTRNTMCVDWSTSLGCRNLIVRWSSERVEYRGCLSATAEGRTGFTGCRADYKSLTNTCP